MPADAVRPEGPDAGRPRLSAARRDRFVGVDLARLVAIVGMMAAHVWSLDAWDGRTELTRQIGTIVGQAASGTPSTLFAVLGGISLTLVSESVVRARGSGAAVVAGVTRGLVVFLIGCLVGFLPSIIVVVLMPFGVAIMLAALFLRAPSWLLAGVVTALALFGGWMNAEVRALGDFAADGFDLTLLSLADPAATLRALLVTGVYPVSTWLAYLLIGMLAARALLRARAADAQGRWAAVTAAIGTALAACALVADLVVRALMAEGALAGVDAASLEGSGYGAPPSTRWWVMLVPVRHSGTIADICWTAGLSLALIALLVAVCDGSAQGGSPPPRPRLVHWLGVTGAAPLSIYVLHVLLTALLPTHGWGQDAMDAPAFVRWLVQVVLVAGFGALLACLDRRGPLESLVSGIVSLVLRRFPNRPAPTRHDAATVDPWLLIGTSETADSRSRRSPTETG